MCLTFISVPCQFRSFRLIHLSFLFTRQPITDQRFFLVKRCKRSLLVYLLAPTYIHHGIVNLNLALTSNSEIQRNFWYFNCDFGQDSGEKEQRSIYRKSPPRIQPKKQIIAGAHGNENQVEALHTYKEIAEQRHWRFQYMLSEQRKVTDVLRVLILLEKKVATFRPENDKDTVKKLTRSSPNKITNSLLPPTTIFFQFYI